MVLEHRIVLFAALALFPVAAVCVADQPASGLPLPTVVVEAVYPGANATVVADTVAAPIEQQIHGIEQLRQMRSRCTNEGTYTLAVALEPGMDLDQARMLVKDRVKIALPNLPDVVTRAGVVFKKDQAGVLMIARLSSPDRSRDAVYLGDYADLHIKDELARVRNVASVDLVGRRERSLRVWLDPEKLAARELTADDVIKALKEQNIRPDKPKAKEAAGKGPARAANATPLGKFGGRLVDPQLLADIIVKTDGSGQVVRLNDLARVELGLSARRSDARFNAEPAVVLCLRPTRNARANALSTEVRDVLGRLKKSLPPGLDLTLPFDFTPNQATPANVLAPEYLLIDLAFPPGLSAEQAHEALSRCAAVVSKVEGVHEALAMSKTPFDLFGDRPCILVSLAPAAKTEIGGTRLVQDIRTGLEKVLGLKARFREPSWAGGAWSWAYPIDFAVHGPDAGKVREFAKKLAERLAQSKKLTDVAMDPPAELQPQIQVDIDRRKAKDMEVSLIDLALAIQAGLGAYHVDDFNHRGRTGSIIVQAGLRPAENVTDFERLKVRNAKGAMVPLGALAAVHVAAVPTAVDRLDGRPMVEVTANIAPGIAPSEAREICAGLAKEVRKALQLPDEYQITWLARALDASLDATTA